MPRVGQHVRTSKATKHRKTYKHQSYHHLYDRKWQKARRSFLDRNPLCRHCMDKEIITAANVVDHIKRHEGCLNLFWDQSNWQALCKTCHDRKTAAEVGFSHPARVIDPRPGHSKLS